MAAQYDVFSVDTSTGTVLRVEISTWTGSGVKVGGPFPTKAAAQAWITANPQALGKTVLAQDQGDVGDWIVVPEGEAGNIINALSTALDSKALSDIVGLVKGDLNTGSGTTYTVKQLTTATQVENAETANLPLYPTKAAAQAAADTTNSANTPSTGPSSNPLAGLAAIGEFFGNLANANTWVRVGEAVLGLILLAVGVARITHAQNVISTAVKAAAV